MKTIVLLILALSASSVMSGTCATNWIGEANEFTVGTSELTVGATDYKFCGYEEGDKTCCTADVVNGFEDKVTDLIEDLEGLAGARDQYILDRRGDVLNVRTSLNRISAAITQLGAGSSGGDFGDIAGIFGELASVMTSDFATLKGNFTEYQNARVTCMEALVDAQAAVWCYACSPDFTVDLAGIDTDSSAISFGTDFNTRIATACYPYLEYSAGQSVIISLYAASSVLSSLATLLEKIVNQDMSFMNDLAALETAMGSVANPEAITQKPSMIPETCSSSTNCQWLISSVLNNGAFQNNIIILGGTEAPVEGISLGRRLGARDEDEIESPVDSGRRLDGEWTPEEGASGITVGFSDNPAGVNNDQNSAIRNGVIACALAALALF